MLQLTNVWSASVYEICAVTDHWSFLTVILRNHCETTVNNINKFVNTAMGFSSNTFIILFSQPMIFIAHWILNHILFLLVGCLG